LGLGRHSQIGEELNRSSVRKWYWRYLLICFRARSSANFLGLMFICRAPTCLPTGFQHPVSGAQNGAGRAFQRITMFFLIPHGKRCLWAHWYRSSRSPSSSETHSVSCLSSQEISFLVLTFVCYSARTFSQSHANTEACCKGKKVRM
jgi:hypothetical protein